MKKRIFACIAVALLLFSFAFVAEASDSEGNTYPTPNRLFYIARSVNKNLVCYDVNLENGELNTRDPLNIYWVNREEHPGETNGLSYFQRKMAYGYKLVSAGNDSCVVTLTAYPDKELTICRQGSKYVSITTIDNQSAILKSLYVKADPNNPLSVEYVELQGVSVNTGQPLTEIVKKK
ncbi:MAG: DUF4833 domain-containing protein [Bacteroidales bacterium]|nr:DUF4833 domain-containing protein [Bacteroidales bacterium]